jgi:lysophospholipid acyltransferase (LPLAT)-like uncharacterized protein
VLDGAVLPERLPEGHAGRREFVSGAYHVHSARSHDSWVAPARYAQAAAAMGLDFVVLTDHNVPSQPAQSMHGVLVLFEREASAPEGHRVELGPYAVAAHPFDLKRPYLGPTPPLAGVEIATVSSMARRAAQRSPWALALTWAFSGVRPARLWAEVTDRDVAALALWDAQPDPAFAGLCGADAHGLMPLSTNLGLWRTVVPWPGGHRALEVGDATALRHALARGQAGCVSGLLGGHARLQLWAHAGAVGAQLEPQADTAPPHGMLRLFRDGVVVAESSEASLQVPAAPAGLYRAEWWDQVPRLGAAPTSVPLTAKAWTRWGRGALAYFLAGLTVLWALSCRRHVVGDPRPGLRRARRPYVLAMLHGHQLGALLVNDEPRLQAMVSRSKDGDLLVPTLRVRRVRAVRGSGRRGTVDKGGQAALAEMIASTGHESPALLAVDGPRGPRGTVHRGVVQLARASGAVIVPFVVHAAPSSLLRRTWDNTQIPWPFARLTLRFGTPIDPLAAWPEAEVRAAVGSALGALDGARAEPLGGQALAGHAPTRPDESS